MNRVKARTYDKEFKLNAIKLYLSSGRSLSQMGKELGVPTATLATWVAGVMGNKKIRSFTPEEFEKLWKAIEQFEGWQNGDIVEVYKISCVNINKKNVISKYCIDNIGWVAKNECISLIKQGKIDAEVCTSKLGNSYARARANSSFQKNFDALIEKNP